MGTTPVHVTSGTNLTVTLVETFRIAFKYKWIFFYHNHMRLLLNHNIFLYITVSGAITFNK